MLNHSAFLHGCSSVPCIFITEGRPERPYRGLSSQPQGICSQRARHLSLFILASTPTQVALASIPDLTLPVGSTPTETCWTGSDRSLALSLGAGGGPLDPPVVPPEPNAGLLSVFGALGLLCLRRRRDGFEDCSPRDGRFRRGIIRPPDTGVLAHGSQ